MDLKFKIVGFKGHNPYFSRWFSAICLDDFLKGLGVEVTILILVDGFLQYKRTTSTNSELLSQSLF